MRKTSFLAALLILGAVTFVYGADDGKTAVSLSRIDKQVLEMPFVKADFPAGDSASGVPRVSGAGAEAARTEASRAAARERSAKMDMARAESVMTSRTADSAQKSQAQIAYDSAKAKAESAKRTQEEQKREASKLEAQEQQAVRLCADLKIGFEQQLTAIGSENQKARRMFAAGDFPSTLASLEKAKQSIADARGIQRRALGCRNFPYQNVQLNRVGNWLLEAQALRHVQGEDRAGEQILILYLRSLTDTERGDAAPIVWDLYGESVRLLDRRFSGSFELQQKLRLPVEGTEIGRVIGVKEMEELEFDLFQGFKSHLSTSTRFDYAGRFAQKHAREHQESFFKDVLYYMEHPSSTTRSSGVFSDDQLFYYAACYYESTGRVAEVPDVYRAYENFVDIRKESAIYRGLEGYRETRSRLDRMLAANHLKLTATTPLKWRIDKDGARKADEKKRLDTLKKQPGMSF